VLTVEGVWPYGYDQLCTLGSSLRVRVLVSFFLFHFSFIYVYFTLSSYFFFFFFKYLFTLCSLRYNFQVPR
jgi:hypothetical protein